MIRRIDRRTLLAGAAVAAFMPQDADAILNGSPTTSPVFQVATPSGGGFVRTMDIHSDGTMVASGDVFPLFISNVAAAPSSGNPAWKPLFTTQTAPAGVLGWSNGITGTGSVWNQNKDTIGFSVWDAKIAPSNSNIIYIFRSGQVFCTQNKGTTWTQVGTLNVTWPVDETNDSGGTQFGHKLRIDPNNPNYVVCGTPENGFFVTTNGLAGTNATWTKPFGTPTSSAAATGFGNVGVAGIVFDTSGGTNNIGATNICYACVIGSGIWRTTTGLNGTWSLIQGSPLLVSGACTDNAGNYYCCASMTVATPTLIMKFNGTAFSTVITQSGGLMSIDINPFDSTNLIYNDGNGGGSFAGLVYQVKTDGTNNLQYHPQAGGGVNVVSGDAPAIQLMPDGAQFNFAGSCYLSIGQVKFDPITPHKIWLTSGIGVFYTTSITSATMPISNTIVYVPQTSGINGMVSNALLKRGTGPIIWGGQDRQAWGIANPTIEPSNFGNPANDHAIFACWDVDATPDGNTIVAFVGTGQGVSPDTSIYSTNGGSSWVALSSLGSLPSWAGSGGAKFAISTPSNWIGLTGNAAGGVNATTNGGATYTAATGLPGSGWPSARANRTRPICADQTVSGRFYARSSGNGLYMSTDGGLTWALQGALPATSANWLDTMQAAPGNLGHLWWCNATGSGVGGTGHPLPTGLLYFSTNSGANWTQVPGVVDPQCFGFGQPAPGFTYPTLWVMAFVNGKWGVWVSKNFNGSTMSWTWLIDYPAGSWDAPVKITGDPSDWTRCYIGMNSSSIIYGRNLRY